MISAAKFRCDGKESKKEALVRITKIIQDTCNRYHGLTAKGFCVPLVKVKDNVFLHRDDLKYLGAIKKFGKKHGYKVTVTSDFINFSVT